MNCSFKSLVTESWQAIHGIKWPLWLIVLTTAACAVLVEIIMLAIGTSIYGKSLPLIWIKLIVPIVVNVTLGIFMCGIFMVAFKKIRGETPNAQTGFNYFKRAPQAMTFMLLFSLVSAANSFLNEYFFLKSHPAATLTAVHLPPAEIAGYIIGIVITLFCYFTIPLIADKNNGVFQAIGDSCKLVWRHFFKVLLVFVFNYVLMALVFAAFIIGMLLNLVWLGALGSIVAIVGAIWLLPFCSLLQANLYNKLRS